MMVQKVYLVRAFTDKNNVVNVCRHVTFKGNVLNAYILMLRQAFCPCPTPILARRMQQLAIQTLRADSNRGRICDVKDNLLWKTDNIAFKIEILRLWGENEA